MNRRRLVKEVKVETWVDGQHRTIGRQKGAEKDAGQLLIVRKNRGNLHGWVSLLRNGPAWLPARGMACGAVVRG